MSEIKQDKLNIKSQSQNCKLIVAKSISKKLKENNKLQKIINKLIEPINNFKKRCKFCNNRLMKNLSTIFNDLCPKLVKSSLITFSCDENQYKNNGNYYVKNQISVYLYINRRCNKKYHHSIDRIFINISNCKCQLIYDSEKDIFKLIDF